MLKMVHWRSYCYACSMPKYCMKRLLPQTWLWNPHVASFSAFFTHSEGHLFWEETLFCLLDLIRLMRRSVTCTYEARRRLQLWIQYIARRFRGLGMTSHKSCNVILSGQVAMTTINVAVPFGLWLEQQAICCWLRACLWMIVVGWFILFLGCQFFPRE